MREIKFRAWDKKKEEIVPVEEVNNWRIGGSVQSQLFEIMQYTELKDKNGVEIYEGDIVKCYTHSISIVEVKKGCFGLTSNGLCEPYFTPFTSVCGYPEIIGNIYENPELLDDKP